MRWRSCALVFLLGVQVVAGADALPEVVVEAVETAPRVGDVVLSETTAAITTISGEALTRPGNSLAQVLSREAGVQIRSSGGLGSYSAATLRGASSDQVMVYLDGLLLNDASGGGFNLADVELMQVDRIDIYRGSTPVQLSTASLGGALDLQSPAVDGKPLWRGQVGAGSFNTRQAGLLFSGSAGKVGGLLSLNARSSDNDFSFRNDNGTALNPADDFDDHRNNAAADQSSLLLKLGKPVADGAHQDASFQYFNKSQQIPDQRNSNFNRASLDTKTLRLQFNHRQNRVWQSDWNTRLGFNLSHKREEYDDRQSTIGLGKQHSRWLTDVAGINNYWEHVGETKSFSLSTDFRREKYHQDDLLGLNPGSIARRDELTLAAQESLFFNGDKTLLTPELRYQVATDYFDVAGASFSGTKINKHITHRKPGLKLGVKHKLNQSFTLTGNAGRYHRLPSFFELFGDRGLFVGNESLRPESGINIDFGIEWKNRGTIGYLNNPSVRLGLFYSDVDDAISRTYDSRGIGKSINIEGALIQGVEWALNGEIGSSLQLQVRGSFQNTENRSFIPAFNGKQLPGQAQATLNIFLDYQWRIAKIYYEFAGKYDAWYDTANLLPAKDQSVHTIGLKYPLHNIDLSVELVNFTDDVYEDFNGYPKPGRAFYLTLSYPGDARQ